MSLNEVRERASDELAAISRGADPAAGVQARKEAPTFGDVGDEWLKRHAVQNRAAKVVANDTVVR